MQPAVELRSELEFLVMCARAGFAATPVADHSLEQIDWDPLLRLAQQHGLLPLLGKQFANHDAVPGHVRSRLADAWRGATERALALTRELLDALQALRAEAIPALPYKGPALAAALYGDVALRQYFDLDLLISRRDVPRAVETLISRGYRSALSADLDQAAYLRWGSEWPLFSPGGTLVEVQWRLAPYYFPVQLEVDDLIERAISAKLGGQDVGSFAPEDQLLVLCVHGGKHRWERLSWACDLAQLVRSRPAGGLDWEVVQERAHRFGIERLVRVGLMMAERIVPLELPDKLRRQIACDRSAARLANQAAYLTGTEERGQDPDIAPGPEYFRYQLCARERWRDRARFLLRLAFAPGPGEWTLIHLPRAVAPLYRLVRLYRLAARAAKMSWNASKARAKIPFPRPTSPS